MSTGDEEKLGGFTAKRNANTKALRQEHASGTQRGRKPCQGQRDELGVGCTNHVGFFDQCILIFGLNEVGSYFAFFGQRYVLKGSG